MIVAKLLDEAQSSTIPDKGRRWEYFGRIEDLRRGPQGFCSELPPNFVIKPHFHLIDQFQIVVRGSAKLGKHSLTPVTVHYVDALVPYGPIQCSSSTGLTFFNLRSRADVGAHVMPESRKELPSPRAEPGRSITEHLRLAFDGGRSGTQVETIVEPHLDGLAVYEIVAPPNASLFEEAVGGSGRYQLVLGGSLQLRDQTLPADSVVWATAGERLVERRAGPEGLHLLEVQLPTP